MDAFKSRSGVYAIKCVETGKVYIGSASICLHARRNRHWNDLRLGIHHSTHLQRAWDKHGEQSFSFDLVEYCDPEDCTSVEQIYIDLYSSSNPLYGYNVCPIAGSCTGRPCSDKTKEKISKKTKGRKLTDIHKAKISSTLNDPVKSLERGVKISLALKGKTLTDKHRESLSRVRKGIVFSSQHRHNISQSCKGRVAPNRGLTDEQIREIRVLRRTRRINAREIANAFGISKAVAYNIINRKSYTNVR